MNDFEIAFGALLLYSSPLNVPTNRNLTPGRPASTYRKAVFDPVDE
jgi:hypothetical protein